MIEDRIELRRSLALRSFQPLVGLGLAAYCFAFRDKLGVIAWVPFAAVGVLIALLGLKQVSERKPTLVVDRDGVLDRRLGLPEAIPWSEISDAKITGFLNSTALTLTLRDPMRYLPHFQAVHNWGRRRDITLEDDCLKLNIYGFGYNTRVLERRFLELEQKKLAADYDKPAA